MKLKARFLLLLLVVSSGSYAATLRISLTHIFEQEELLLSERTYSSPKDTISITQLKYYLGNIVLAYEDGKTYSDSVRYHLIDLEKKETLLLELTNVPEGTVKGIGFSIGVDSLTNASGLMDGDLDPLNGMYWAWSSGYINFKIEGACLSCTAAKEFTYHIGGFLPPNETFQVLTIPFEKEIDAKNETLELIVNIGALFKEHQINDLPKLMSPSAKAKDFAMRLPQMFSVKR